MTDLTLGQMLGGYRLDEVAGRGGMGVVYRATQVRLERVVALKVIAPELASDPAFRERFQREARLLASVDDPNVVPVYEADEAEDQLFLSMRWIDGGDLADEIAGTGGLEPDRAQQMLAQVASGLDAVHAHGLIHGDLKPANMLIEHRSAGSDRAFLSDFGAGRSLEATATGNWLGTVDYVRPRDDPGRPARRPLGSLWARVRSVRGAHRLAAVSPRHGVGDDVGALQRSGPSACERRPALPRAVDAVLARGLAKDPDARYTSGERLLEALSDALVSARGAATGPIDRPGAPARPVPEPAARELAAAPSPRRAGATRIGGRRLVLALGGLALLCARSLS